jgi:histidinol dehydrogenase
MPHRLNHDAPDFDDRLDALLSAKRERAPDVERAVDAIIAEVREAGDAALIRLTQRYDRLSLTPETLEVSEAEHDAAERAASAEQRAALELAAARIRAFHDRERPEDARWTDPLGVELGWRWTPVDRAGLYAPGGAAAYPSSVLMNAIPARVAGVREVLLCTPTPGGALNPLVLVAARLAGVDRVFRIGGAQAIAAMAFGTASVPTVDVIAGPGNAYVAAAKRRVFGQVGIDSIAGPSEVLVIAEAGADPERLALDLMAQAEHDAAAQSVLATPDAGLAEATGRAVERLLQRLPRADIAGASWRDHGALVVTRDLAHAAEVANRMAPEHLELCLADPEALLGRIRHAGAIFLGPETPEALGDYVAGPNHVLPTSRAARHASGLSVQDFMKRTTLMRAPRASLATLGPAAATLARAEGLEAHALSVERRLETKA